MTAKVIELSKEQEKALKEIFKPMIEDIKEKHDKDEDKEADKQQTAAVKKIVEMLRKEEIPPTTGVFAMLDLVAMQSKDKEGIEHLCDYLRHIYDLKDSKCECGCCDDKK